MSNFSIGSFANSLGAFAGNWIIPVILFALAVVVIGFVKKRNKANHTGGLSSFLMVLSFVLLCFSGTFNFVFTYEIMKSLGIFPEVVSLVLAFTSFALNLSEGYVAQSIVFGNRFKLAFLRIVAIIALPGLIWYSAAAAASIISSSAGNTARVNANYDVQVAAAKAELSAIDKQRELAKLGGANQQVLDQLSSKKVINSRGAAIDFTSANVQASCNSGGWYAKNYPNECGMYAAASKGALGDAGQVQANMDADIQQASKLREIASINEKRPLEMVFINPITADVMQPKEFSSMAGIVFDLTAIALALLSAYRSTDVKGGSVEIEHARISPTPTTAELLMLHSMEKVDPALASKLRERNDQLRQLAKKEPVQSLEYKPSPTGGLDFNRIENRFNKVGHQGGYPEKDLKQPEYGDNPANSAKQVNPSLNDSQWRENTIRTLWLAAINAYGGMKEIKAAVFNRYSELENPYPFTDAQLEELGKAFSIYKAHLIGNGIDPKTITRPSTADLRAALRGAFDTPSPTPSAGGVNAPVTESVTSVNAPVTESRTHPLQKSVQASPDAVYAPVTKEQINAMLERWKRAGDAKVGELIKCSTCGEETSKRTDTKRFCSDKCRIEYHRIIKGTD